MGRREIKGMTYERKQRAAFLRATRGVLKNHQTTSSVTYDIYLINKILKSCFKLQV